MSLHKAFLAGFVRRWHTNPDLAHTVDRIDGHSGRVARIILMLHPNPRLELVRAALIHDDGEFAVGDMKAPIKDARPDIAEAIGLIEVDHSNSVWGHTFRPLKNDRQWLKFADRLDAYMWAAHHAPHVMDGDGWPESWEWIWDQAGLLGCRAGLGELVDMRRAA